MSLAAMLKRDSFFSRVSALRPDAIFALTAEYHQDQHPNKVNLGQGTYRDGKGEPFVLESVRKARQALYNSNQKHEYLPILGLDDFRTAAAELALGADIFSKYKPKVILESSYSGSLLIVTDRNQPKPFRDGCTPFGRPTPAGPCGDHARRIRFRPNLEQSSRCFRGAWLQVPYMALQ